MSGTGAGKIDVLDLHTWELQKPIELTAGVDGMSWLPMGEKWFYALASGNSQLPGQISPRTPAPRIPG